MKAVRNSDIGAASRRLLAGTMLCLGGVVGCVGIIDRPGGLSASGSGGSGVSGSGGSDGSGGTGAIVGMRSTPGDLPLPRLSHDEYVQTLRDLLKQALPSDADAILSTAAPMMTDLPADALVTIATEKHGGFARADQSEQQQYSDVPIAVAAALGTAMTQTKARIATLFGSCSNAGASVDGACLQAFVRSFGEIALRRPLSDDDVTFYTGSATANPPSTADLATVIAVMLSSPRFLYRVESGDQAVDGTTDRFALDGWELAARLSYHFWGSMPDATLRAAARSGKLLTDDGYTSEVDRMMSDPRADTTMRTFFQQWLWPLIELPPLDSRANDVVYRAFAGANLPGPSLRAHMVADVLDAASWETSHGGTLATFLTNRLSFARDADLAAIYGVTAWNGQGMPPTLPDVRVGLLTRAAFLSTGTVNSRPIMKGVFIRESLLCDTIPPPPPNAANTPIVVSPNQTTRDVIESITEGTGTSCAGCHKQRINPLGFASENFDGLGRVRTEQAFFDSAGNMTGSKAINTVSVPAVTAGDTSSSQGIADTTQLIVNSGKVERCMATKFFRFAFRRLESAADAPAIDALTELARTKSLGDLFKGVTLRPEFKERVIEQ